MKTGIELITEERARQIAVEGYDSEHDAKHTGGELALAACCYAAPRPLFAMHKTTRGYVLVDPWPFEPVEGRGYFDWDKRKQWIRGNYPMAPEDMTPEQRLELLVKAGAFIAAEIDRLNAAGSQLAPASDDPHADAIFNLHRQRQGLR